MLDQLHQGLLDEFGQVVEGAVLPSGDGDGLDRVDRQAVREQRQSRQQLLRPGVEQPPAPLDHGQQGPVPLGCAPVAASQQGEPVVQAALDLIRAHAADPRGGEFDGER